MERDVRYCVTLEPAELPWPLRFYFLATDEGGWKNVGFEMGVGEIARRQIEEGLDQETTSITPSAVRFVHENFFHYLDHAQSFIDPQRMIRGKKRVTPEFAAYVAAQYDELGGTAGAVNLLAKIHGVDRTTIYRWRKTAQAAKRSNA